MSNYLPSNRANFCYDPTRHRQDIEVSMGGGYFLGNPVYGDTDVLTHGRLQG